MVVRRRYKVVTVAMALVQERGGTPKNRRGAKTTGLVVRDRR